MGLFSKKTFTCERCGKEYETRLGIGAHICEACVKEEDRIRETTNGYETFGAVELRNKYSLENLSEIEKHRNEILERHRADQGVLCAETMGANFVGSLFMPCAYPGVVVDGADVFAAGITRVRDESTKHEVMLAVLFTNDPYMSVFPMVFLGKLGFFEIMKSKGGREELAQIITSLCPNLAYPVMDLKDLKKQIKADGMVKGNIPMKKMKDWIFEAESGINMFKVDRMPSELPKETIKVLREHGIIN